MGSEANISLNALPLYFYYLWGLIASSFCISNYPLAYSKKNVEPAVGISIGAPFVLTVLHALSMAYLCL